MSPPTSDACGRIVTRHHESGHPALRAARRALASGRRKIFCAGTGASVDCGAACLRSATQLHSLGGDGSRAANEKICRRRNWFPPRPQPERTAGVILSEKRLEHRPGPRSIRYGSDLGKQPMDPAFPKRLRGARGSRAPRPQAAHREVVRRRSEIAAVVRMPIPQLRRRPAHRRSSARGASSSCRAPAPEANEREIS